MLPVLVALTDGPDLILDKPILMVGRHQECDIQIESRKVSRRHCCFALVNDALHVRDLESTNGVRVNGARVQESQLQPGDEVTLGNLRYRVTWEDMPHSPVVSRHHSEPALPGSAMDPPGEDDVLESCDLPIPLAESSRFGDAVPLARKPAGGSGQRRAPPAERPSNPAFDPQARAPGSSAAP